MRVWGALQASALLASVLWTMPLAAKKDHPTFAIKGVENRPRNVNYFPDSEIILYQDADDNNVYRSPDGGATWARVDAVSEGKSWMLFMHEFDNERAYIITQSTLHYRTSDRGKTWKEFSSEAEMSMFRSDILQFHATDPDRIIFNGMNCQGIFCQEVAMYTIDGFKTKAKPLRENTAGCWWAKSSDLFTTGENDLDKNRILCIVMDDFSPFKQDQRLLVSDNFFDTAGADSKDIQEFEPNLDTNKAVQGIVNVAAVKKYLLVATTSMNTDEMALFVTDDTKRWHRAMFPTPHESHDHRLMQEAYTVLESTNYSIQIDVMSTRPSNPMGVLFTSNSNGTFFTENIEHTNRNHMGHVDFEKISGIQGIFMVNKVENWKEVEKGSKEKKIVTEITFDDGRTFESVTADGKRIHLHSVTELTNVGRVFSSPAPGIVMGNGNTGDYLKDYKDADLYVSDDAGKTWTKALEGPHKYEFGDQGSIIVAVRASDNADVSEINYSLNHGVDWVKEPLPDDLKIEPYILTTVQDSTSLKFLLIGKSGKKEPWKMIFIDFDGLHEATCKESDMEEWFARTDKDGKPTCLMGHTQSFHRRKKKAECFLKQEFRHAIAETKDCDCTDLDYECDFNFVRDDDNKCVPRGLIIAPEGACRGSEATFKGTSGYRKIPGNTCKNTKELDEKYKDKEWECKERDNKPSAPATDKVEQKEKKFGSWDSVHKYHLDRGESNYNSEETVIMRPVMSNTKFGDVWISHDQAKTWAKPEALADETVISIIPHAYFSDLVFFIAKDQKVLYTTDRGLHFHHFKAPTKTNSRSSLQFHPDKKDWLIWEGEVEEDGERYRTASISEDRGDHWKTIARYVRNCEFTGSQAFKYPNRKDRQIVCLRHEQENTSKDNPYVFVSSNDWFENENILYKNAKGFATMGEFIVVATEDTKEKTLHAHSSLNGIDFADAHFPLNYKVPPEREYTVMDSSTHAINLFVASTTNTDRCRGDILKSNSNGTSYVVSVRNVNCNEDFYVDFEKMLGLEGVALVNTVSNPDDEKGPKKLQTKITHNDGGLWRYLPTPDNDEFGSFPCRSNGDPTCALHIHGYTERRDHSKMYSNNGAVGVMFGWGNVGPTLASQKEADTFMTIDGGASWRRVQKGRWSWAFGDHGGIMVLAHATAGAPKSKSVFYSLDQGASWKEHVFSEKEVQVLDITTLKSGSSRAFVLWGLDDGELFSMNLDFSGFTDRLCKHDDDTRESDYYVWSAKYPELPDDCLFGHKSQYLRKKPERKCYNDVRLKSLYKMENCPCVRQDYECDYNYEYVDEHGQCGLVPGYQPPSLEEFCAKNPDAIEYYRPTGLRKIPLSTCVGGQEYDKQNAPEPCTGHKDEFDRRHGTSGLAIFFAVTIPFAVAAAAGWWVWRNWNGKFGQIRLGEQGTSAFDSDQPWVKYPVIALSAVVAVVMALPVVAGSVWRAVRGLGERWGIGGGSRGSWSRLGSGGYANGGTRRFTTRDSFARGSDYVGADDDEGELLGEDSDEEV